MAAEWPEWAKVGAEVVIVEQGSLGIPGMTVATIERFTPTQMVIRGVKYKLNSGKVEEVGGGSTWRSAPFVLPSSDPLIAVWREEQRIRSLKNKARIQIDFWLRDKGSNSLAHSVIHALTAVIEATTPAGGSDE